MDQVLDLVGQLYDAALEPRLWTSALAKLCVFFGATRSVCAMEDALKPSGSVVYSSVEDPEWHTRYMQTYLLLNPVRICMMGYAGAGDALLTTDYMTPAEYRDTRFSKEFLADRGIADIAVAILEQTASRITVLSACTGIDQGFADEALRRKLQLVLPHAQRAVKIARLLEHKSMMFQSLAETLDALEAAVFLMSASGGIVHANASATKILSEEDAVYASRGRLNLWDRVAGTDLELALEMAAQGDAALGSKGRSIGVMTRTGRQFVATLMPLTGGRRREIGSPYDAIAALCLKEAEFELPSAISTLATRYDLTPREMAVLIACVDVGGASEIAPVLGLAESTVKTHLKSVYRKTGASRQSDLVKIVAGTASPFP